MAMAGTQHERRHTDDTAQIATARALLAETPTPNSGCWVGASVTCLATTLPSAAAGREEERLKLRWPRGVAVAVVARSERHPNWRLNRPGIAGGSNS